MATQTREDQGAMSGLLSELPVDRLKEEVLEFGKALARRGAAKIGEGLTGATGKLGDLGDVAPGPGDVAKAALKVGSPVKEAASKVKDVLPGTGSDDADEDGGGNGKGATSDDTDLKVTNIVETIDVPVSRDVAYELWTQFEEFPAFMKKVETVTQKDPEVVTWKAQVFWSHRTWTAKIIDQVPPEHIVWKSDGDKGHVDGAVTFHELAPDLTRVLVSLEYFPQGLFERTGNLWRAQGRRVRLELKHYRRFVANHALLQQDEVDGWEGEIHDGKVKRQRGSSAKKSTSNGSTAKKSASGSSGGRGSTAKKSASGSSSGSSSTAKKSASGNSGGSSSTAKKTASSGSTTRKRAAKKTASKRTSAASKRSSTSRSSTSSTGKRTSPASRPRKASASRSKSGGSSARKSSSGRSSGSSRSKS